MKNYILGYKLYSFSFLSTNNKININTNCSSGSEAFAKFQAEPHLFDIYHGGFREQASHWPENPLGTINSIFTP